MTDLFSKDIINIGVNDYDIDLFESQYEVPNGMAYNSYVIMDEKIAIMDTVDARATEEWFKNLNEILGEKTPDYLVVQHMEPDHAANIAALAEKYPSMQIVGNTKTFAMTNLYFNTDFADRRVVVAEGDTLELGRHTLTFVPAPMVHWPEVMVSYEFSEKVLFSADAFGKFGTLDADEDWTCEARRYYFNIVGKYGAQVQALLKKAAALDIKVICPLHGPVLTENLEKYIDLYNTWSSYTPEDKGVVVACASIHGNTKKAALELVKQLEEKGEKVTFTDLTRDDIAEAVEDAFRYDRMVIACCTYNGGLFPAGENFISHLKGLSYQNRKVGFIENGSWAPQAARHMKAAFEAMKNISIIEPVVTLKGAVNDNSLERIAELADALTE